MVLFLIILLLLIYNCNTYNHAPKNIINERISFLSSSSKANIHNIKEYESLNSIKNQLLIVASGVLPLLLSEKCNAVDSNTLELMSDEYSITIDPSNGLGLGLSEIKDKYNRIIVNSIKDNAPSNISNMVKKGHILVSLENKIIEGLPLSTIGYFYNYYFIFN